LAGWQERLYAAMTCYTDLNIAAQSRSYISNRPHPFRDGTTLIHLTIDKKVPLQ
jgi:hypothetical protein